MFEMIPFDRTFRRMAGLEPDSFTSSFLNNGTVTSNFRTDVSDTGSAFQLDCELPGFKKEDINISVEKELLTISVERRLDDEEKKAGFVKRERFYGSFSRSFDLTGINTEDIAAKYEDGILTITLPKKAEEVPASHRIEIM